MRDIPIAFLTTRFLLLVLVVCLQSAYAQPVPYHQSAVSQFNINAGLNDAWYNPLTDGQGVLISVMPDSGIVFLAWFTYDTQPPPQGTTANVGDPGQRWFTAQGPFSGNQAVMDITITRGGLFDTPSEVHRTDPPGSDGMLILTFDDCYTGMIEYDIPSINRKGTVPIQRIVNDNVALCEELDQPRAMQLTSVPQASMPLAMGGGLNPGLNDAWFDPSTDGQGFLISVMPETGIVFLAWFTYDTELPPEGATANLGDPGHRWLTAQGPYESGQATMNLTVTSGGLFDYPSQVERTDPPGTDGTLTLAFDSCYTGTVEYDMPALGITGTIPIQRIVNDNVPLCEVANQPPSAAYKVGVNYFFTKNDFENDYEHYVFLTAYHDPEVRTTVQAQLAGMAAAGADVVKTGIWLTGADEFPGSIRHHFPLTADEVSEISEYAEDVAAIDTPQGKPLELQLTFHTLWCADYMEGNPDTTVGQCGLDWQTYIAYMKQSALNVMKAVAGIYASDGTPVVKRIYLNFEVMVGAKPNEEKFLLDLYPWFVETAAGLGLNGSIYFNVGDDESGYFDDLFQDNVYPELYGHRSMVWLYRSVQFLRKNDLPVPDPITFSFYVNRDQDRPYNEIVERVFNDFASLFPGMHAGIAESTYPSDHATRLEFGQAYEEEYLRRGILEEVLFWPYPGGLDYPYEFNVFR